MSILDGLYGGLERAAGWVYLLIDGLYPLTTLSLGPWWVGVLGFAVLAWWCLAMARRALKGPHRRWKNALINLGFALYAAAVAIRYGGQGYPDPYLSTWGNLLLMAVAAYRLGGTRKENAHADDTRDDTRAETGPERRA